MRLRRTSTIRAAMTQLPFEDTVLPIAMGCHEDCCVPHDGVCRFDTANPCRVVPFKYPERTPIKVRGYGWAPDGSAKLCNDPADLDDWNEPYGETQEYVQPALHYLMKAKAKEIFNAADPKAVKVEYRQYWKDGATGKVWRALCGEKSVLLLTSTPDIFINDLCGDRDAGALPRSLKRSDDDKKYQLRPDSYHYYRAQGYMYLSRCESVLFCFFHPNHPENSHVEPIDGQDQDTVEKIQNAIETRKEIYDNTQRR